MSLDSLELELRRLPGVRAAGFRDRDDLLLVQLQIGAESTEPNLALQASQIAARHVDRNVAVELVRWRTLQPPATAPRPGESAEPGPEPEPEARAAATASSPAEPVAEPSAADILPAGTVPVATPRRAPTPDPDSVLDRPSAETPVVVDAQESRPGPPPVMSANPGLVPEASAGHDHGEGRVRLLTVLSFPDADEIEVHLAHGSQRTIGRAVASRGLLGAVEAAIEALSEFTSGAVFTPAWTRTLETGTHQYLVVIGLDGPNDVGRYGIAGGDSPLEAAARATLHALNRTVDVGPVDPAETAAT